MGRPSRPSIPETGKRTSSVGSDGFFFFFFFFQVAAADAVELLQISTAGSSVSMVDPAGMWANNDPVVSFQTIGPGEGISTSSRVDITRVTSEDYE